MRKLLQDYPLDLCFVENGYEAIEAHQNWHPDLIFMDISMPQMDGKTATGLIRDYERSSDLDPVPIIALTAHAQSSQEDALESVGMDDYITKPLRKHELTDALRTHAPKSHTIRKKLAS